MTKLHDTDGQRSSSYGVQPKALPFNPESGQDRGMGKPWTFRRRARYWFGRARNDPSDALERFLGWLWKHPGSTQVFGLLCGGVSFALWLWPAAPGIATAILAIVAMLVSISKMTYTQRFLALLFTVTLVFFEIRDITIDRVEQATAERNKFAAVLAENRAQTNIMLRNSARQFADTETNFQTLMEDGRITAELASKNLRLSTAALQNITGGRGFIYLAPRLAEDGSIKLDVWSAFKYRVTSTSVTIRRIDGKFPGLLGGTFSELEPNSWGDIISDFQKALQQAPTQKIWVLIDVPGGMDSEVLEFRKGQRLAWAYRFELQRVKLPTSSEDWRNAAYHAGLLYKRGWTEIGAPLAASHPMPRK